MSNCVGSQNLRRKKKARERNIGKKGCLRTTTAQATRLLIVQFREIYTKTNSATLTSPASVVIQSRLTISTTGTVVLDCSKAAPKNYPLKTDIQAMYTCPRIKISNTPILWYILYITYLPISQIKIRSVRRTRSFILSHIPLSSACTVASARLSDMAF